MKSEPGTWARIRNPGTKDSVIELRLGNKCSRELVNMKVKLKGTFILNLVPRALWGRG